MGVWGLRARRVLFVCALGFAAAVAAPAPGATAMPAAGLNFTGQGPPSVGVTPPDPMGAAGANHYVQVVNLNIEVWNKNGTVAAASRRKCATPRLARLAPPLSRKPVRTPDHPAVKGRFVRSTRPTRWSTPTPGTWSAHPR